MYNFSVEISDLVAASFEDKLKASTELGINNIEISDVVDGTKFCCLGGEQLERMRDLLIDHGKRIVLLSTSLDTSDKENFNLLFRNALVLNVKGIKITPKENDDTAYITRLSRSYGIPLFFENCADSFLNCEQTMQSLASSTDGRLIFNPLEFVKMSRHPFFHVYYASKIKDMIAFLRINDGLYKSNEPIMLYHGCAEVKELASIMLSRSYDGYFSFTPYLSDMTLDTYREIVSVFKKQLKNM